ncbi:NADH-ubiquinone oxidoreductase B12 subunit family-domain-containing protein [Phascolomyces articulosus]|uniref:NADH-ubiquinone oxidoreductase B12 subunit family-domain-containing protein n=1 Tax=Phascolomyces articulosus TaxID=60185 RepID=A0AAD5K316_9FUNG|nr:NADH-ubiquinone oxidoreductase B12 subunit family-domain-containing protein [Phascolomyces articulosus]
MKYYIAHKFKCEVNYIGDQFDPDKQVVYKIPIHLWFRYFSVTSFHNFSKDIWGNTNIRVYITPSHTRNSKMPKFHTELQQNVPVYHDPWAKREAWRKHPIFSKGANFRSMFPGLGIATVAFIAYCGVEKFVLKDKKHH